MNILDRARERARAVGGERDRVADRNWGFGVKNFSKKYFFFQKKNQKIFFQKFCPTPPPSHRTRSPKRTQPTQKRTPPTAPTIRKTKRK